MANFAQMLAFADRFDDADKRLAEAGQLFRKAVRCALRVARRVVSCVDQRSVSQFGANSEYEALTINTAAALQLMHGNAERACELARRSLTMLQASVGVNNEY